jgi:hypothetical protein
MTTPRTVGILRNNLERAEDIIEDVETIEGWKDNPSLLGIRAVAQNMAASLEGLLDESRCSREGGCVCGGDTPAVRSGCANWIK